MNLRPNIRPLTIGSLSFLVRLNLGRVVIAAILVAVVIPFASAQDPFDYHTADLLILQSKDIQSALGVNASQRDKMNTFAEANRSKLLAYKQELIKEKKAQPDNKKLMSYVEGLKRQVFGVLTPAQLKRLREISLQHDGLAALGDDEVAKKVGLSAGQLKQIREIIVVDRKQLGAYQEKAEKPVFDKYKGIKPKNEADAKALKQKFDQDMAQAAEKYKPMVRDVVMSDRKRLMAVLTPAQRATWQALLGKPFKG
jgi:hypothetical protein